jgi:GNAT superfamily N-acetyltransferase
MSETQIKISRAVESDLSRVRELAQTIWRAHYPGIISNEQIEYMLTWMYSLETLQREVHHEGVQFELLRVNSELVGFAAYGPTSESGVYKLHKLYVHPDQQGQGLGSRLLNYCEDQVATLGAEKLILAVNKQNRRAIRTYERNGFSVIKSVCNEIGGGFVMNDYIMAKSTKKTS